MAARDRRLGIVFVHGFNGTPDVWEPFERLLANDPELRDSTQRLRFQYNTRMFGPLTPLRRMPTLTTVADSLRGFLEVNARHLDNLVLVCHSQGGLVAQFCLVRIARSHRAMDLRRIRRVVLFACPNNGTEFLLGLRRMLHNPQEAQLRPLDAQIAEMQRSLLHDIVPPQEVTDTTCPVPFSVYAGETDNIVTVASAQHVFRTAGVLPGDHSSIVRPDGMEHRSYVTLKYELELALEAGRPNAAAVENAVDGQGIVV